MRSVRIQSATRKYPANNNQGWKISPFAAKMTLNQPRTLRRLCVRATLRESILAVSRPFQRNAICLHDSPHLLPLFTSVSFPSLDPLSSGTGILCSSFLLIC
jgi:hypothetical protein